MVFCPSPHYVGEVVRFLKENHITLISPIALIGVIGLIGYIGDFHTSPPLRGTSPNSGEELSWC